jgi:hypothetical protein
VIIYSLLLYESHKAFHKLPVSWIAHYIALRM